MLTSLHRFKSLRAICLAAMAAMSLGSLAKAQQSFKELVGPVKVAPVSKQAEVKVPYITWGGDVATFLANGGLKTKSGSVYDKAGLKVQLTAGDDFVGQVRSYVEGKSPFLRGTLRMLGQASEVIGSSPQTKPVVILQLSWSAGDHIVGRKGIKSLNELKGKKIACQQGGPHVGLLYDSLVAAGLTKQDVTIVWTKDLTGPDGAAEKFRQDSSVDACCVITPDLLGLTGGFEEVGSGAEGTVEGARLINSTQQMSRSIADVYAVRKDWYDANQDWVQKFVSGYLNATEATVKMRGDFEKNQRMASNYRNLLKQSQQIFGEEVLPTLEIDAHGLLLDCGFVGLPGQVAFFQDPGNLSGFDNKMSEALDMATKWGYATKRLGFDKPNFDYQAIAKMAGVKFVAPSKSKERFAEPTNDAFFSGENLDPNTIVSFSINFEPNEKAFSIDRYGSEFQRALKAASTFGNARVVIRGHSDPTKALSEMIRTGMGKGLIKRTGSKSTGFRYYFRGKPLDIQNTSEVVELIAGGQFSGGKNDPAVTMQAALNLSKARAEAVKKSIVEFAQINKLNVDLSQIVPVGAGISEPVIAKPTSMAEARENMRVEFRIVKVNAEMLTESDFDF